MMIMKQIKKMSKYVIYIDEDERHKNNVKELQDDSLLGKTHEDSSSPEKSDRKGKRRNA